MFTIAEIMTTEPYTLRADESVRDALDLMSARHIRHIPIVDDKQALVGVVTHRDVLAATDSKLFDDGQRHDPATIPLERVMTRDVKTITTRDSLRYVARFLESLKIGCLPVVEDDRLVGIVTDSDFVGVAINLLEQLETMEPVEIV